MFDNGDLKNKLEYPTANYEKYLNKVREYPRNSMTMSKDYLDYFEELLNNKNQVLEKRHNIKLKRFPKI